ncbi:MAG: hypothetical protein U9R48_02230 [Chloroflexota bacterium]|nr:hypothetical protein [Chloroflexota bacterium]
MAEIKFSVLDRRCLDWRILGAETPHQEVAARERARNACAASTKWQFTTDDAHTKLAQPYPSIED